ncbi:hypothetical protein F4802DRAFT_86607 [Xylaria palmicola]|nr:hypothetical protein F4802DRAFT_86607 [Xylaria palmicola]
MVKSVASRSICFLLPSVSSPWPLHIIPPSLLLAVFRPCASSLASSSSSYYTQPYCIEFTCYGFVVLGSRHLVSAPRFVPLLTQHPIRVTDWLGSGSTNYSAGSRHNLRCPLVYMIIAKGRHHYSPPKDGSIRKIKHRVAPRCIVTSAPAI